MSLIAHPQQVVENEAEPTKAQPQELIEHGRLLGGVDPFQPGDLQGHRLDRRAIEVCEQLRGQRLLQADQHDRRLPKRGDLRPRRQASRARIASGLSLCRPRR